MRNAIEAINLTKSFGSIAAVDNISFTVPEGDFFGLLGPNGAGKTTLIRMLTTLIAPTSGRAAVMGLDVVREQAKVRSLIGVIPQAMTSDLDLTGHETMDIYARFYGMGRLERKTRIDELLSMVGLKERAFDLVATYSGGMRRRLEIARGLVHEPRMLILDEPTIGLDPQSRHVVWEILERFRASHRMTVLLTTHYMEEAEALCDHVAIIDNGRIAALDTVHGLKMTMPQKDIVELTVGVPDIQRAEQWIKTLETISSCAAVDNVLKIYSDNGAQAIPELFEGLKALGIKVSKVMLKEQTLEDVFIHYTGRPIREEEAKKVSFFLGAGVPTKWGR